LRAFALLLGIVFHSILSFVPGFTQWAVQDRDTSHWAGYFVIVCHSFRLEIFFLIAGFFAHLVFHARGFRAFARDRAKRILLPFVVGWLLVAPMLTFVWVLGDGWQPGPAALIAILDLLGRLAGLRPGLLGKSHLWFLYYLMLLYVGTFGLRAIFVRFVDSTGRKREWLDRRIKQLVHSRLAVLVLAAISSVFLWGMRGWGVDTPDRSLVPHVPTALLYGFIFCLGWMMHRQPDLLGAITPRWWAHLALGMLVSLPTAGVLAKAIADGRSDLKALFVPLYAVMMWLLVFGVMGFFLRFFSRPSTKWRYLADSSYWLYITHLPLVAFLQVVMAQVALPWIVKLVVINLVTFPILLVSYHYVVRSTFIGGTLNGKKHSYVSLRRVWLPRAAAD